MTKQINKLKKKPFLLNHNRAIAPNGGRQEIMMMMIKKNRTKLSQMFRNSEKKMIQTE